MDRVHLSERSAVSAANFTKRICFQNPQVLAFVLTFAPGQQLPAHRHPGSTVVLQVHRGQGVLSVDGHDAPISAGDALLVTGDETLAAANTGDEPLVLFVTLSPNPTNPAYAAELG